MSVTSSQKLARLYLLSSMLLLVAAVSFSWAINRPTESPDNNGIEQVDMKANALQMREAAIAEARAKGENTYSFETSFMPGVINE